MKPLHSSRGLLICILYRFRNGTRNVFSSTCLWILSSRGRSGVKNRRPRPLFTRKLAQKRPSASTRGSGPESYNGSSLLWGSSPYALCFRSAPVLSRYDLVDTKKNFLWRFQTNNELDKLIFSKILQKPCKSKIMTGVDLFFFWLQMFDDYRCLKRVFFIVSRNIYNT